MNNKAIIIILAILVITGLNSFFIVEQRQTAIVVQLGKPVTFTDNGQEVSFISTPGLKFKLPFIQKVYFFDARLLNFEATDKEVYDSENKTLTVNAFARYKIVDPLTFHVKVINQQGFDKTVKKIFEASLLDAIGKVPLKALLTDARKEVMQNIKDDVTKKASDFGIKVEDVRIVRADLPKENSEAIFKRMFTDRNKEAREYRAQGKEQAQVIISTAEKEATIIEANAQKDAKIIRGNGDAIATKIFAQAFNKDPEFYGFFRSMQAYRATINKDNTSMVLSPDSEFLSYFGDIGGNKE
jgi:membrane protease subunit HflC